MLFQLLTDFYSLPIGTRFRVQNAVKVHGVESSVFDLWNGSEFLVLWEPDEFASLLTQLAVPFSRPITFDCIDGRAVSRV